MDGPIHAYSLLINHYIDDNVDEFATHTVKFASFEPLASAERLSTVSSPYMVGSHFCQHLNGNFFITVLTIVAMLAVVDFLFFRLDFRYNLSISLLDLTKASMF